MLDDSVISHKDKFYGQIEQFFPGEEVPDYKVLLSFCNDEDGIFFREWWEMSGRKLFTKTYKAVQLDRKYDGVVDE